MSVFTKMLIEKMLLPMRRMKETQFEELTAPPNAVVFLGDSITEGGLWPEWFPESIVVNRGIDSDMTTGVLRRLPAAVSDTTRQVFLLIGTNDLSVGTRVSDIADNLTTIVTEIKRLAPSAQIIVQSVMPRKKKHIAKLKELNRRYQAIASHAGATYIDLWGVLAEQDGTLRPSFTEDALHLNGAGYRAWVGAIDAHVARPNHTTTPAR